MEEKKNTNILEVEVPEHLKKRVKTGIEFFDVVTSGGLVPSTTTMLSGQAGSGKTTLCAQIADSLTERGNICLFNSAEQTAEQVSHLCSERLKLKNGFIFKNYKKPNEIKKHVLDLVVENPGKQVFFIVDSLTKLASGKRALAQEIGNEFIDFCQATHTIGLFIVHLTKNGQFQGNNGMLHDFDAYYHMEVLNEDADDGERLIVTKKNRFGKKHTVFTLLTTEGHIVPSADDVEVDDVEVKIEE